jgi:hypothetical protein
VFQPNRLLLNARDGKRTCHGTGGYYDDVVTEIEFRTRYRTNSDFLWAWSMAVTVPATTSVRRRWLLRGTTE